MTSFKSHLIVGTAVVILGTLWCTDILAQRGRGGGGGGGGGRSAGHQAPSASRGAGSGPAMSRPQTKPGGAANVGANHAGSLNRPTGASASNRAANGTNKPNLATGKSTASRGSQGFQNPGVSRDTKLGLATNRPQDATGRPKPAAGSRPSVGGGASSAQFDDFLGNQSSNGSVGQTTRPDNNTGRPNVADRGRPGTSDANRKNVVDKTQTAIGDRQIGSRDVNVGDVNVGNTVNYSKNQQAWLDNRHATGNQVRDNAGNRYTDAYRNGAYRQGAVGGYGYYSGWGTSGNYYGWRAPTYAAIGGFLGAGFVSAQPIYYGYGTGGNVYYEDNAVYVAGQAAGTSEQYAQQALAQVAAAPPVEQVQQEEWLPLGVFVLTREDVDDSQTMLELAVSKKGVLAGTYYNEATGASRPLKGTVDQKGQRAIFGFADGINADLALETGIYNLTKDEAPALLHHGAEESTPVLLVRLPVPEDTTAK